MHRKFIALLVSVVAISPSLAQAITLYAKSNTRDRFAISVSYNPCALAIDTERPPEVETVSSYFDWDGRGHFRHKMRLWLRPNNGICGVPPPGGASIDLGLLVEGDHYFNEITVFPDTTEFTFEEYVEVDQVPGDGISGAWYSPQQSGRGLIVTKLPVPNAHPVPDQRYAIYWATHDGDGNPTWLLVNAPMQDFIVQGPAIFTDGAPLSAGTTVLHPHSWGSLRFEYLGCGKGRLSWDADDPSIADGAIDVIQLARPAGLPGCEISADVEAVWLD